MPMINNKTTSVILWFYAPILFFVVQIIIELFLDLDAREALHSENGLHEVLQPLISGMAFCVAIFLLKKINWQKQKLIGAAVLAAALGSFYITGEEISWGQHIASWSTPEFWAGVNDQGETNLHNTSSWLDQKPRLFLFIGIVIGGIVVPLMRRCAPYRLPPLLSPLYPSNVVVLTALGVTIPHLVQKAAEFFGTGLFIRVSEVQEIYMYYFVLIYLLDLRNREFSKD